MSTRQNDKVKKKDLVEVASAVSANWEEVAARLKPDLFTVAKIKEIDRQYDRPFTQSLAMLEKWSNGEDKEATNGSLIKVLLKMDMRAQANKIFGDDFVKCVERSHSA